VLEKYPDQVKLLFLSYPLARHPFAKKAAIAAFAARKQGKFWEYHDLLFQNQDSLDDQKFRQLAHQLGLDQEKFEEDIKDLKTVVRVNQDIRLGAYVRVRGTPTVFINGKVSKARTLEALQVDVERELEKVKQEGAAKSEGKG